MILDNEFWGSPSETSLEQFQRLRKGLDRLHSFHRNAVTALDYMCHLDVNLASGAVVRMLVIPIMCELDEPLGLGADFESEHTALERSIAELNRRLSATHDLCLADLNFIEGSRSRDSFRKLDSALLSPISILDFLLAEAAPAASARANRARAQRTS